MRILVKGYYGFKNFGDEFILLPLLTWIEEQYQPDTIDILCGDVQWLEQWVLQHRMFIPPIFDKLHFLPMPSLFEKIKMFFGREKKKYDLIVLGGGEVIDETRKFPHDGRNFPLLYRKYVSRNKFVLLGGFGTHTKKRTEILQNMLFSQAKHIGARDFQSFKRAKFLVSDRAKKKIHLIGDFTLPFLEETKNLLQEEKIKNERGNYILINMDSFCDKEETLMKISQFIEKYPHSQPIYMAMDFIHEQECFHFLQEHFPNLELFNWTSEGLLHTLKCLYFAQAGIGTKLHFLYPLKVFEKEIEILNPRYKIETNLRDLEHQELLEEK